MNTEVFEAKMNPNGRSAPPLGAINPRADRIHVPDSDQQHSNSERGNSHPDKIFPVS